MITLLYAFFLSLALFFTNDSIAMDASLKAGPPLSYKIEQVRVSLTRRPGSPSFPILRLIFSGSGNAILERDGGSVPLSYSHNDLLDVLNELYKIRFFELPENYTTEYSVFLDNNDTVQTTALRLSDFESTTVCFAVPNYKKCVTYSHKGPVELEDLVKRLFSDADKLHQRSR
jgi:hypothetical protein